MPTVTFSKKVILDLIGQELSDEILLERIPMLGTDLEKIEGDQIFVEIFPNRPDLLSEQGFARALASFLNIRPGLTSYTVKPSDAVVYVDSSVASVRPHTACAIVKGLTFDDEKIREIIQIQEKLHIGYGRNRKKVAIGIYPLDKITFPVTFFAENPKKVVFTPLEFPRAIDGLAVLSQHPTGREFGHLLEGKDVFPFFKDANGNILSMPPIINSHDVGKITTDTTEVFIECSGFDYGVLSICLAMVVTALADMGGEIYSVHVQHISSDKKHAIKKSSSKTRKDVAPTIVSNGGDGLFSTISPILSPIKFSLDYNYINQRLGLLLSNEQIITLLARMGIGFDLPSNSALIPAYRADILHTIDLVEDIAIAYGYENFAPLIPKVATIGKESALEQLKRNLSLLLVGLRLTELYSYNIVNTTSVIEKLKSKKPVMLANALSEEYNCLRPNVLVSLLDVLSRNKHNEYPQQVFDSGVVFSKQLSSETGVGEHEHLAIALCDASTDYTKIKQMLDYITRNLDITYSLIESSDASFIQGRAATVLFDGIPAGVIGEIHPSVLNAFAIEYPISALELDLTVILTLLQTKID